MKSSSAADRVSSDNYSSLSREAELSEDGTRIRQLSRKWYGCYTETRA